MARRQMSLSRQGGWGWMDWADLAIKGYGAVTAADAADDAKDVAKTSTAAQSRALDANTAIALSAEGRSAEAWDNYMGEFMPAKLEGLRLARKPINPNQDAAEAGADFAMQDSVRGATLKRNLGRAGVDAGSGAAIEAERLNVLDSTAGKVAAMGKSRRDASDRYVDRLLRAADSGQGLIGASTTYAQTATNANAGLSNVYGNRATQATGLAGQAGEQFGRGVTEVLGGLKDWWNSRKEPEPTGGPA